MDEILFHLTKVLDLLLLNRYVTTIINVVIMNHITNHA